MLGHFLKRAFDRPVDVDPRPLGGGSCPADPGRRVRPRGTISRSRKSISASIFSPRSWSPLSRSSSNSSRRIQKAPLVLPLCLRIEHFTRVAESTHGDTARERFRLARNFGANFHASVTEQVDRMKLFAGML